VKVQARKGERQCPLCWDAARRLGTVPCPDCGTRYHRECADELEGRCATLGCLGALPTSPPAPSYLERFQGRPRRRRRRRRPARLGRRWAGSREGFCWVNAWFGAALWGLLSFFGFAGSEGMTVVSLCALSAGLALVGGLLAGFRQEAFWGGVARRGRSVARWGPW
jgi:hypothetical protein